MALRRLSIMGPLGARVWGMGTREVNSWMVIFLLFLDAFFAHISLIQSPHSLRLHLFLWREGFGSSIQTATLLFVDPARSLPDIFAL
ncbi:hypothetical protein H4582DRAFT_1996487 [Lactarius indigo]|nr:hypothetical protein H4582DRAFT_1996487 [Lactarius indigo]